jgi:hypothetical protein
VLDHRFYFPKSDHLALWNGHPLVPPDCRVQPVAGEGWEGEEGEEGEEGAEAGDAAEEAGGAPGRNPDEEGPVPRVVLSGLGSSSTHHSSERAGAQEADSFDDYGLGPLDGGLHTWDPWDGGTSEPWSPPASQLSALRLGALRLLKAYVAVLDAAQLYATRWLRDTVRRLLRASFGAQALRAVCRLA